MTIYVKVLRWVLIFTELYKSVDIVVIMIIPVINDKPPD